MGVHWGGRSRRGLDAYRPCTIIRFSRFRITYAIILFQWLLLGDDVEFDRVWMAHETDVPLLDAFPNGWGDAGGDALD